MSDCPEIQGRYSHRWEHPLLKDKWMSNLKDGDFYYNGYNVKPYSSPNCAGAPDKFQLIWLPRIDDLIKMIYEKIGTSEITITNYSDRFEVKKDLEDGFFAESLEVCFLQLVMHELHNKIWNGEEWGLTG